MENVKIGPVKTPGAGLYASKTRGVLKVCQSFSNFLRLANPPFLEFQATAMLSSDMPGIFLALASIIFLVLGDSGKKHYSTMLPLPVLIWTFLFVGVIINVLYILVLEVPVVLPHGLSYPVLIAVAAVCLGEIFFLKAVRSCDFSLVQPFRAAAPILALISSVVFFREIPSGGALVGIIVVLLGVYLMYAPSIAQGGILAPFRSLASDPGPRFMVLNQFFGVVAQSAQKAGGLVADPVVSFTLILAGTWAVFSFYLIAKRLSPFSPVTVKVLPGLYGSALFWAIGVTLIYLAANYTLVVYVFCIGQLQPVFALPVSKYFFKEEIRSRIWPCVMMVGGVLLIVLF